MKYICSLFFACLFIIACDTKVKKEVPILEEKAFAELEELSWILGEWNNINSETESYETWIKASDSVYIAYSTTLRDKDTVFAERMQLYYALDTLRLYVETVGPEPNPVMFTQRNNKEHAFTFENRRNPFPSKLVYTRTPDDKIHAWVEGEMDGKQQKIDFYFVRDTTAN